MPFTLAHSLRRRSRGLGASYRESRRFGAAAFLLLVSSHAPAALAASITAGGNGPTTVVAGQDFLGALPLAFVENTGQWATDARFLARTRGMDAWIRGGALDLVVRSSAAAGDSGAPVAMTVRVAFEGASSPVVAVGESALLGTCNYFLGADPDQWHTHVSAFASVHCRDLYAGIDLRLRSGPSGLHYDLHVAPGVDAGLVRLRIEGTDEIRIEPDGSLVARTPLGVLRQTAPAAWEHASDGERRWLPSSFRLLGADVVEFAVLDRSPDRALVIDPGLEWSSYFGGSQADRVTAVGRDPSGNVVLAGRTLSPDLPITPGLFGPSGAGSCFVTKLDPTNGGLVYSTYLGGGGTYEDQLRALDVGAAGDVVVVGSTYSSGFPITPGVFDSTKGFGQEGFVTRIRPDGTGLVYSTFLGGMLEDAMFAVRLDTQGFATIGGWTWSPDFPSTPGAFDPTLNTLADGVLARLNPTGSALVFSTFLGGAKNEVIWDVRVLANGEILAGGYTASPDLPVTAGAFDTVKNGLGHAGFVARFDPTASNLLAATFLEGSDGEEVLSVGADASGRVYASGWTASFDFPVTPGALKTAFGPTLMDGFVSCFDPGLTTLLASTYLGGSDPIALEEAVDLEVDASGIVTVVGYTSSGDFPTTPGSLFPAKSSGWRDGFVARLRSDLGSLLYSTFLHPYVSDFDDQIEDAFALPNGSILVGGFTISPSFPTTAGAYQTGPSGDWDGFACQLDMLPAGVTKYGGSTPSCLGSIAIGVNGMPASGDPGFGLTSSGSPPASVGVLALGAAPLPSGLPVLGVQVHIDLGQPLVLLGALSDAHGWAERILPLPSGTTGLTAYFQFVWLGTPTCGGAGTFSASNALHVTVL